MKIEKEFLEPKEIIELMQNPAREDVVDFAVLGDDKVLIFVKDDETGETCAFFKKSSKDKCLFVRKITDEGTKKDGRVWFSNDRIAKATKNPSYITNAELVQFLGNEKLKEWRAKDGLLTLPQFGRQIGMVQKRLDSLKSRNFHNEEGNGMVEVKEDFNGNGRSIAAPVRQRVNDGVVVQYNPVGFVFGARKRVDAQIDAIVNNLLSNREKNGDSSKKLTEEQVLFIASKSVREVINQTKNGEEKRVLSANIEVLKEYAEQKLRGEKVKPAPAVKQEKGLETIIGAVNHLITPDFNLKFAESKNGGETVYALVYEDGKTSKNELRLPLGGKIGTPDKKNGTRTVAIDDIKNVKEVYLKLGLIDEYSEAVVDYIMNSNLSKRKSKLSEEERNYVLHFVKETIQGKTVTVDDAAILREDELIKEAFESPEWIKREEIKKIVQKLSKVSTYEARAKQAIELAGRFIKDDPSLRGKNESGKLNQREKALTSWTNYFLKEAQKVNPLYETALGDIIPKKTAEQLKAEQEARLMEEIKKEKDKKRQEENKKSQEEEKNRKAAKRKAIIKKVATIGLAIVGAGVLVAGVLGVVPRPNETEAAKNSAKTLAQGTKVTAVADENYNLQSLKAPIMSKSEVASYEQQNKVVGYMRANRDYAPSEVEAYAQQLAVSAAMATADKANLKDANGEVTVAYATTDGKYSYDAMRKELLGNGYTVDDTQNFMSTYADNFTSTYNQFAKNFDLGGQTKPDDNPQKPSDDQPQNPSDDKPQNPDDDKPTKPTETDIELNGEIAKGIYTEAIQKYDPMFSCKDVIIDGDTVYVRGESVLLDGTEADMLYSMNIEELGSIKTEDALRQKVEEISAKEIGETRAISADYYMNRQKGFSAKTVERFQNDETLPEYYVLDNETMETTSTKGQPGVKVSYVKITNGEKVENVDGGTVYGDKEKTNFEGRVACSILKDAWGEKFGAPSAFVIVDPQISGNDVHKDPIKEEDRIK